MVKLEFGIVGFWGEGKTGVLGEKGLGAKERTNNKLNPHVALTPGFEPGPQWWEASALTTAPFLAPIFECNCKPKFIYSSDDQQLYLLEKTNLIKSLLSSSCQLLSQRFISPVPNWRNIVGQWPGCHMLRPFAHPVACCCVRVLLGPEYLRKVWNRSNFLWNSWSLKRSATLLDPFVQLSQHSWGLARVLGVVYKVSWAASFPRYTEGSSSVGNCCIRLRTTANTDVTTPNIVGPTVLEVVASVCT